MPLPIEFDLDVLLVQGQHCLNVGLRDMKVTLHDVCGGLLATAVFMKPVCLILGAGSTGLKLQLHPRSGS